MANLIPDPIILPDPSAALPGQPIRAAEVRYTLGCLNAGLAHAGAGPAFAQAWGHTRCSHAGATPQTGGAVDIPIALWRLPVVGTHHRTVRVSVLARRAGVGAAFVSVRTRHGASSEEWGVGVAAVWETVDLALAAAPDSAGWDEVGLYLRTDDPGCQAVVEQIEASIVPLASPLPTERIDGGVPFGLEAAPEVDRPLPGARGVQVIDGLEGVYGRPQILAAWSGLDPAYPAVHASDVAMPSYGFEAHVPTPGAGVRAWTRVQGAGVDERIRIMRHAPLVVGAADADEWVESVGPYSLPRGGAAVATPHPDVSLVPVRCDLEIPREVAGLPVSRPAPRSVRAFSAWTEAAA